MTFDTPTSQTRSAFYGWIAISGTAIVFFFNTGAFFYSYGVFLPTMCGDLEWSRGIVATGYSLGILVYGLPSPLIGYSIKRFGSRINIILGNLLAAAAMAGMFLSREVWHVYLLYSLVGLGSGFGQYMACTTVANNWFMKKRSLALAIVGTSSGLAGFVFPPLVTLLIDSIGWRSSWLVLAGILLTGACLLGGVLLVRNRPEDMGQVPDGERVATDDQGMPIDVLSEERERSVEWPVKQALRQPTTWFITVFVAAQLFAWGTMFGHQVAYVQEVGFSPMIAAMTLSLVSGISIIGRLGFGALALKSNVRYLTFIGFVILLISLSIILTTENLALIYIYAGLFGIGSGALLTALPTLVGKYYGRTNYAVILGVIWAFGITLEAVGPAAAGVIYDLTSEYTAVFWLLVGISLIGMVAAFMAWQPKWPSTKASAF